MRKKLYRAVGIVEQAWHRFRENAYEFRLARIRAEEAAECEVCEEVLFLMEKEPFAIPDRLVGSFAVDQAVPEEKKMAYWDFLACTDVVAYMHDTVERLLKGKNISNRSRSDSYQ